MAHLVLYDGVCGLCHRSVRVILENDPSEQFLFASMQSALGERTLTRIGRSPDALDSLILIVDYGQTFEQVLQKSAASLFIARRLGGIWQVLSVAGVLPRPVLDTLYRWIAGNRYRWFGVVETCPLPNDRHRHRFLDN